MIVRELITVLGFEADEAPLDKFGNGVNRLKRSLGMLAGLGTAVAGTMFALAQSTANTGDEAAKAGQAVGLTAEQFQEYTHTASIAGVSGEELQVSLRQISKAARDAARGTGTAKDTLAELGIELSNADGSLKSTDQMVESVADRFQSMPDGPEKTAAAMDLFGRSGAKMITMLNEGGDGIRRFRQEAHDLGVVIDNDTAAKSEEFNDTLFRMKQFLTGLKQTAGAELIPIFIKYGKSTLSWAKANRELIKTRILEFVESLVKVGKALLSILKVAAAGVSLLSRLMGGLENVIKFATLALMAFVAVQVGSAIYGAIQAVIGLAVAFKAMGIAGMVAWIKAAWPIALVIAGILAVILLVEDFVGWTQGKDSIFGRIFGLENSEGNVKKMQGALLVVLGIVGLIALAMGGWVIAVVAAIAGLLGAIIVYWDDIVDWAKNAWNTIVDWAKDSWAAIVEAGQELGESLAEFFWPLIDGWETAKARIRAGFQDMIDTLLGTAQPLLDVFEGVTSGAGRALDFVKFWEDDPEQSGAQLAGAYVGGGAAGPQVDARRRVNQVENSRSTQTNVGEVTVNVQGSSDMSPAQMSQATQDGVNAALRRQVENASEAFDGAEDY